MLVDYTVLKVDGTEERHEKVEMALNYEDMCRVVEPHLEGGKAEHVYVLDDKFPRQRSDMFVDDDGIRKGLPRNEAATALYRNATLKRRTGVVLPANVEDLPAVCGPAVIFDQVVWS